MYLNREYLSLKVLHISVAEVYENEVYGPLGFSCCVVVAVFKVESYRFRALGLGCRGIWGMSVLDFWYSSFWVGSEPVTTDAQLIWQLAFSRLSVLALELVSVVLKL